MLENVEPLRVFHYFENICAIPHGSGNTDGISEFCVNFAREHGLEYKKDALNNVIIKKAATAGYENHPTVILQGHLDMVCEKTADCDIDFKKDGLRLVLTGDMLSADGTTLGADDGIAVAMILAVLEDETAAHPPLEALFTTDEETGMYGAEGVDVSALSGSTLINLDSGEEGVLTVGCAGGAKADFKMPVEFCENTEPCVKITVSGLLGGHSGIDINKGRLNADTIMGRLLGGLNPEFRIVSLCGGFKDNVIPNACECVIATNSEIGNYLAEFAKSSVPDSDKGLKITAEKAEKADKCLTDKSTAEVVKFLSGFKSGVVAMSQSMPGLVESSQNLGIANISGGYFNAVMSVRSSVKPEKQRLLDGIRELAAHYGAELNIHGDYPAWEYRENSRLRDKMTEVFAKMYGRKPTVETVHAGLECGLLGEKIAGFDAVSLGPDMWDIHTANEHLSVSSAGRVYEFLRNVLKEL